MPIQLKELTLCVLLYVALVDCLIALFVAYEIFLNKDDSWEHTVANIAYGGSAAVAVTIVVLANVDVVRLPAKMYERKQFNEGVEQGRQERDKRLEEAYERFGMAINGVRLLPNTPEVQAFLRGKGE